MSSTTAIAVSDLGKRYKIQHEPRAYGRLTESLADIARAPLKQLRRHPRATSESIWALRNVSFEVPSGRVLGVIGRNGAGKSTLLKILSRITEPTTGRIVLKGRVGSLLEVGTGFHPELTGRENIFLSGSILGMRRADIERTFDDIVDFSGVARFLDTPVKRYSSGMQVRLGFAVAAHLEPDILLVDEVLAVGDAEFQRKCLGKLAEVGQGGRTVVFVSHSMPAILRLCDRALLLDRGGVIDEGPTQSVVTTYLESTVGRTGERAWLPDEAPGNEVARLRHVRVLSRRGVAIDEVDIREPIDVEVAYESAAPEGVAPSVGLHFYNDDGICLFATHDWHADQPIAARPRTVVSTCRIPGNFFAEGRITVTVSVATVNPLINHAVERDAVAFVIVDRSEGDGVRGAFANDWPGVLRPWLDWHIKVTD